MLEKIKLLLNLKGHLDKLLVLLKGKKTVIGALSLFFWAWMYAIPVLAPEYSYLAESGKKLAEFLMNAGLPLDKELLLGGMGFTVIGLLDKLRRMLIGGKD